METGGTSARAAGLPVAAGPAPSPRSARRSVAHLLLAWLVPSALIAGLVVVAVQVAVPSSPEEANYGWEPLAPGATSIFQTTADGQPSGRLVSVVTGPALLEAVPGAPDAVVVAEHWDNFRGEGSPVDAFSYAGWAGSTLLDYGARSFGTFNETKPPEPLVELPLKVGKTWQWHGQLVGAPTRTVSRLVGFETVHALGRTLTHCAHFTQLSLSIDSAGQPQTTSSDDWDCFGLGEVKERDVTGGHVYEQALVRFVSSGRTLSAPGATTVTPASSAPGSGPGIDQQRSNAVIDATSPTERPAWTIDLDTSTQMLPVGDSRVTVVGGSNGTVWAIDRQTGQVLWQLTVPGPLPVAPTMAGSVVLVADAGKHLLAVDVASGALLWSATFPDLVASAPAVSGETVVVVGQDQVVRALRLTDGRQRWSERVSPPPDSPPVIASGAVVVGEREGGVEAFSLGDGSLRWEHALHGLLSAGPDAGGGLVVAGDDAGGVYGFDAAGGKLRWERHVWPAVTLPPAVTPERVVLVSGDHELTALSARDGRTDWSATLSGTVVGGPVVLGHHILALHEEGTISQLSLSSGREERTLVLPTPGGASASLPLQYFGGDLVATLNVDPPYPKTSIVALPAGGGPAPEGVSFEEVVRSISPPVPIAGPIEPPVASRGSLLFPGTGKKVWSVPASGTPVALVSAGGQRFFAIPDGDLVITQEGADLVAIPRSGGAPRWAYPVGTSWPWTVPIVTGDLVVAPDDSKGLVALDRASGRPRWFFPAAGNLVSPPLALPGGDVLWVEPGGLVRIDGRTGQPVWSLPGVVSVAPLAERDGVVVVGGSYQGVECAFGVDAVTGALLWLSPLPTSVSAGPAIGPGVAVVPGGDAVRAFDLETGVLLWSLPVDSAMNGPPVILGHRVVLGLKGRGEDIDSQGHTITVVDLRSGRLLGLLQIPGAANPNPFGLTFGAGAPGTVVDYETGALYIVGVTG